MVGDGGSGTTSSFNCCSWSVFDWIYSYFELDEKDYIRETKG